MKHLIPQIELPAWRQTDYQLSSAVQTSIGEQIRFQVRNPTHAQVWFRVQRQIYIRNLRYATGDL